LAIGEPDLIGKGLGASLIQQFADQIVFAAPFITGIVTDVEEDNLRSISAFKKAGFQMERVVKLAGDNFNRCVMRKVK
jgi:RimJ/RimL family protein N-acetyltransferase